VTLLALHFRDCLVEVLDHNFFLFSVSWVASCGHSCRLIRRMAND
jgi:hypothetical protein